jgi:hypothetical protein
MNKKLNKFINIILKKFLLITSKIKVFRSPLFIIYDPDDYLISDEDYTNFCKLLKPGDIVLRSFKHYLIGKIIPGFYSHAGIYIGDNTIIHAIGKTGITEISTYDFAKCDALAIIRPKTTAKNIKKAIKYAKNQLSKSYDFWFDFESEKSYSCTELVYWCYENVIDTKPIVLKKLFGTINHKIIRPDQFLYDKKCTVIWESNSVELIKRKLK